MSCTTYTKETGVTNWEGWYDDSDIAYDQGIAYDGLAITDYTETSDITTSYSETADVSTAYTENWGELGTPGLYDSATDDYDEGARTYDGTYYTVYSETADNSTNYLQRGLCLEIYLTDGQDLESTDGEQLLVNIL